MNYGKSFGLESKELDKAIQVFFKTKDWSSSTFSSSNNIISDYLIEKNYTIEKIKDILDRYYCDSNKILIRYVQSLTNKNPEKGLLALHNILEGNSPCDVFSDSQFINSILGEFFKNTSESHWKVNTSLMNIAIKLCWTLTDDPNPPQEDEYHKEVLDNNSDLSIITTTRGSLAFTIRYLACSKQYFKEGWELTKKLLNDQNLYVVYKTFYSFYEILRRRSWDNEVKEDTVQYLWKFFNKKPELENLDKQLLMCFQVVRDLNEKEAEIVLDRFVNIKGVESLFLFYALYRKNFIKEWGNFNSLYFQDKLKKTIESDEHNLGLKILRRMALMIKADKDILHEALPFIQLYNSERYATNEIINSGFHLVSNIADLKRDDAIAVAADIFSQFIHLDNQYIRSSEDAPNYREYYYFEKICEKLYKYSPEIFYDIIELIFINLSITKSYFDRKEVENIIFNEHNPKFCRKIIKMLDKLVETNSNYYGIRKKWLEKNGNKLN